MQHGRNGGLEALMRIADHELHTREPTSHQAAQESEPEGAVLARAHVHPQYLSAARRRIHPDGDDDRERDDAAVPPPLDEGRVQPDVGVSGALEWTAPEAFPLLVELLTERRDLALAHALQPERLHDSIDAPGGDALHVRLLHRSHQRPLRPAARFEQAGEIAAIAHARHAQADAAHPRVPLPLAVAIALPGAPRRALVPLGAYVLPHLHLHERLAEHAHTLSQEVDVLAQLGLAQQLLECHAQLVGHPVLLLSGFDFTTR